MTINERISLPLWKKIILYVIYIITFTIQLAIIFLVADLYINYTTAATKNIGILYIITYIIAIFYVLYIIAKPISANYKITWCVLILLLPVPFCTLYSLNSLSRRLSKAKRDKIHKAIKINKVLDNKEDLWEENKIGANLVSVVQHSTYAPVYKNTQFKFFANIYDKYLDMLEEIKKAKRYILLEYFIIGKGYLMDNLLPILQEKGKEGIKIYILYDDIGSKGVMTNKLLRQISEIINCKIDSYQPLGLNFNLLVNYRDHRKIAVIDGKIAYCGGDNLADEYIHKKERFGYFRDNCGKYEGEVVNTFKNLFLEMWYTSTKEILTLEDYKFEIKETKGYIMAFGDGPINNADPGYDLFVSLINSAKKYVYISTPYLIIDDSLLSIISLKAKSGVDVRILMPKIPDKKSAFYMGRGNYQILLKAGVKIFEYTPGFNHAKNIIVDDEYVFLGTINFDYRSLFLHYECGALIINNEEINTIKQDYLDALAVSELISYEKWKAMPSYQKLIAFILNLFSTLF